MRRSDPAEKAPVFYIGKGIIILSLVITSSLSFALGFFVGKGMRAPSQGQTSAVTPLMNSGQEKKDTEVKEVPAQQPQPSHEVEPAAAQKTPEVLEPPKPVKPREDSGTKKARQPQETKLDKGPPQAGENQKALNDPESKNSRTTHEPAKVKYSVQIGAFKNASDADSLKSKFAKKGYKSFIMASKRKDEKLYKVMIGEFHRRKDAELLSVKMKKTEGLKAFVTLEKD